MTHTPTPWFDLIVRAVNSHEKLVMQLEETNDLLVGLFGQVSDPDNRRGWSDEEAYAQYRDNLVCIAKAREG